MRRTHAVVILILVLALLALLTYRYLVQRKGAEQAPELWSERCGAYIEVVSEFIQLGGVHCLESPNPTVAEVMERAEVTCPPGVEFEWSHRTLSSGDRLEPLLTKEGWHSDDLCEARITRMDGHTLLLFDLPVDINSASAQDLEALPGVGPALARAIVDYRTEHGPFREVGRLLEVRGVGQKKLAALTPHLTVDSCTAGSD